MISPRSESASSAGRSFRLNAITGFVVALNVQHRRQYEKAKDSIKKRKELGLKPTPRMPKRRKKQTLEEVNALARKKGMTYGQLQALMYLEDNKWGE